MSRGLDLEPDDERGGWRSGDHRRGNRVRDVEKPLPKEVAIWRLDRDAIPVSRELPARDRRDEVRIRGVDYRLRQTEVDTLEDVGRFRTVEQHDLERFSYAGNTVRMREDLRSLREQGLLERRRGSTGNGEQLSLFTLTAQGRQVAEELSPAGAQQQYYDGFVKVHEAEHDATLYRMFQAEEARIRDGGGSVKRVVLDFELKRQAYSRLAQHDRRDNSGYRKQQQLVAAVHGLRVVHDRIQFPDLRIEYEDRNGQEQHLDLELTTGHYSKGQISAKAAAGFKLYSLGGTSSSGGSAMHDERDLTVDILRL